MPAALEAGEYVLSFRWDCKCTPQVTLMVELFMVELFMVELIMVLFMVLITMRRCNSSIYLILPRSGLFAAIYWSCRPQQLIITIIVGSKEKTLWSTTFPANHCSQLNWVKGPVKKHLKCFQIISYFYRHFILLGEGDQLSYIANGLNQSASSATQPQTIIRTFYNF